MWFSIKLAYVASLVVMALCGPLAERGGEVCYPGWTRHGNSCYILVKDKQTWPSAQTSCQAIGGNLVQIDDRAENNFLWGIMQKHGADFAWIGMTDLETEGIFRWIFSHRKPYFVNFTPGEPNNVKGKEHCVHMGQAGIGTWNDRSCGNHFYFVCEAYS